ncbi:MAG: DUF3574 domain-containing protein [Acidobacteriota bacterium]|nr:DUF3574 domain-containing protein [Acidobacteriota bacterium]
MNKFLIKQTLALIFAALFLFAAPGVYAQQQQRVVKNSGKRSERLFASKPFLRTELFFGRLKADGSEVSAEEWQRFLAGEVTTRFPAGFTVLEGYGQFRNDAGKIIRENSFVLIVLYPLETSRAASRKIEEIRRAYLKAFQQQSVLRVDFPQTVRVSF